MNLNKHLDFLNPTVFRKEIHVIGVGAVGSRIVEQLVRMGFDNISIYDFDTVDDINIPNQWFTQQELGMLKVEAVEKLAKQINPDVKLNMHPDGYENQKLTGAVFLAVDSIDLRRKIATDNQYNDKILVMFDGRMRLTDAQYYGANWRVRKDVQAFLNTMQFTDESAEKGTPVSACGSSLSVAPTVLCLASTIVSNFLNYVKEQPVANMALIDPFSGNNETMFY